MPRAAPTRKVGIEEARRIAVRSQLLDGSATGVLDTVRKLGFLQLDPIATVATPQHLVLWSRLGTFDTAELDRLLWVERKLVEWNAFIWPIETLPLLQARMRRRRGDSAWERRHTEFLASHRGFRRYVLAELEARGPAPLPRPRGSLRYAVARPPLVRQPPAWARCSTRCTTGARSRSSAAGAGSACGISPHRWYPETELVPLREADRRLAEVRFRARRRPPRARRLARTPRCRGRPGAGTGHAALAV